MHLLGSIEVTITAMLTQMELQNNHVNHDVGNKNTAEYEVAM